MEYVSYIYLKKNYTKDGITKNTVAMSEMVQRFLRSAVLIYWYRKEF